MYFRAKYALTMRLKSQAMHQNVTAEIGNGFLVAKSRGLDSRSASSESETAYTYIDKCSELL